ncbi:MAG: hypothetical protein FJX62_12065, partial [Alphaproteobacteria bacterium]|nr:hypothetical protein [Alphaproteobacteria bacterium]
MAAGATNARRRASGRWRRRIPGGALLAAVLLMAATEAHAQNGKRSTFVLQSMQPHSTHSALRNELARTPVQPVPKSFAPQATPKDRCLGAATAGSA